MFSSRLLDLGSQDPERAASRAGRFGCTVLLAQEPKEGAPARASRASRASRAWCRGAPVRLQGMEHRKEHPKGSERMEEK